MFKPNFTITPSMLNAISEISEIKTVVERSRVLPLNEAQLRRQAIVRMAHTSTSIEGNPLAEFQVDKVLSGQAVHADEKSIQEVRNYQKALQEMERIVDEKKPLSLDQILHLHTILMHSLLEKEKTGRFRRGPIYIVDDLGDEGDRVRFEGPEPGKVPYLLNELLSWVTQAEEEKLHPVVLSGIFAIQFVSIHPFSDGNGRITRLLTQLILYKLGWDFKKILVLEDYYNRNRQAYYDAEHRVQGVKFHSGEDLTPWLEYFTGGFLVEARKVNEKIASIGFGSLSPQSEQVYLDRDEIQLMDFITTTGRITSQDVEEILGIAKRTAQLKLKNLIEKGLLKTEGNGPSTFYTLKGEKEAISAQ